MEAAMGTTLSRIIIHIVFSTKDREPLITDELRAQLFAYIGGIVKNEGAVPIIVGGMPDHVHVELGLKPASCLSDLVKRMKASSSKWVNEQRRGPFRFSWQRGYGAFSVSESNSRKVYEYIKKQAEHHRHMSFKEELLELVRRHGIRFDEQYLWS